MVCFITLSPLRIHTNISYYSNYPALLGKGCLKRGQFTNGEGENELKGGMVQVSNKYRRLTDKSKSEGEGNWD